MLFIKNTLPAKLISIGVFLFLLLMINCSSSHSKKEQAEVLASIKEMQVTKTQFENAFREYYYRTGQVLNQDFNTKQAILNNEFNTYVLAAYAEDLGLDETEEALRKKEAIKRRVINEEFLNQVILSGIEVTEQELQEYYVRFNSQLRASHIYAESKEQINEYYSRLKAGESFDDLAKEAFTNKYMAENGGDIGRFTTDDLDIAFENASFALKIDEISEPVRTAQGYSIIKLTERVTKPILTEYEFAQQKPQLTSYVLKKKKELATRDHLLTFAETVLINEERLTALWNSISQNYEGMLNKDAEFLNGLNFEGKTLAGFQSFNLSMDDFLGEYLVSSPSMLNTIVDQQSLKEFIIGIAYRAYLFEQAELNGIDDQQIVQKSIEETYYHFLADETNKYLAGTIQNTPAELYNTFLENEDNFAKPLEINLSRIVLNSEKDAVVVLEELSKGSSFESLVKKYTVNNEDRFVDGELGYRSIKDFGFNSNQLAELKIGDVTGIVQYQQGEYHIYKCLGRIESRSMVFSEARDLVDDFLTKKKLNVLRASTIDQVKEKHRAEINLQKLQELTIQI